ncbi:double zinc ribbon protein [Salana multivorans]|uniref:Double zinc ribbon protein n=1 Tax=Salana multivorans TaxID=120377 RepID=A0A3N2DBI9_9MICO|nr:FHA domain-containing protein [Salana multivorans]ROR97113.1 double zinc ribbon protein [Salana multivorans]
MATCPQGHLSQADDYCDTCGEPIGAAAGGSGASGAGAVGYGTGGALDLSGLNGAAAEPVSVECPTCGTPAAPGALFCENCGYDFTTGTAAAPLVAPEGAAANPAGGAGAGAEAEPGTAEGSAEAAEAEAGDGEPEQEATAEPAAEGDGFDTGDDAAQAAAESEGAEPEGAENAEGEAESEAAEGAGADPEGTENAEGAEPEGAAEAAEPGAGDGGASSAAVAGALAARTAEPARTWVAEVWVDPDWYAEQRPEDAMPSAAAPVVVPLRRTSVLVGRPSRSRGIEPDVDCGTDAGVSRRHAQLSTDGLRWWIEDLGSANGTYVSPVGSPIPTTPIQVGERVELEEGTRVYLGGWTRLVVREAFPGEA